MAPGHLITRRRLLSRAIGGLVLGALPAGMVRAQVTDLRGFDPLWRSAEEAIDAFFGQVHFERKGLFLELPKDVDVGTSVPVTIRLGSKMTAADHPKVIHLLAQGNPTTHVLSAWLSPACGKAEFSTRIRLEQSQTVTVVAQMSDGRYLRADRDVSVSVGACGQIGTGSNDDVFAFVPQSRVSVPARAKRGAIVPVRTVISHPMETGMRLDGLDEWVRQRIISNFECTYSGAELFRARLYPAVATNPYFQFFARAEKSGSFEFGWYDIIDETYTNRASILVE